MSWATSALSTLLSCLRASCSLSHEDVEGAFHHTGVLCQRFNIVKKWSMSTSFYWMLAFKYYLSSTCWWELEWLTILLKLLSGELSSVNSRASLNRCILLLMWTGAASSSVNSWASLDGYIAAINVNWSRRHSYSSCSIKLSMTNSLFEPCSIRALSFGICLTLKSW